MFHVSTAPEAGGRMLYKRIVTSLLGLSIGLALLFGSAHITSTAEQSQAVTVAHAQMLEGPGVPRFCQQVGAQILAVQLELTQPVSQAACRSFFQSRSQAEALTARFCQQAYDAMTGNAGTIVSELGGPFANAEQCVVALNALGNWPVDQTR
jgi:hypothetical protein